MSRFDYMRSLEFETNHESFYALVMAAMRRADESNAARLREAFPEVWDELQRRYDAPAGLLPGERAEGMMAVSPEMIASRSLNLVPAAGPPRGSFVTLRGDQLERRVLRELPDGSLLVEDPETAWEREE